jgi:hypothetical protein
MFLYDPKEVETKPEVKLEPWRQNLLDAAQYIREHGWIQKAVKDSEGRVCLIGALQAVGGWHNSDAPRRLREIVSCIPEWNNADGRTKEEVIAVLEKTARQ